VPGIYDPVPNHPLSVLVEHVVTCSPKSAHN
jgi:hypothetical protein